jgi:hypothetical protein
VVPIDLLFQGIAKIGSPFSEQFLQYGYEFHCTLVHGWEIYLFITQQICG